VRPWFIYAPNYTHASAGVVVLHRLCHKLRAIGIDAAVSTPVTAWGNPWRAAPGSDAIVVYPEITAGNPLCAARVVRYVLYFPGALGGDREYDPNELAVAYHRDYHPTAPVISIAASDESLFYPAPKTHDVVYVHKGATDTAPWPVGAFRMDSTWPVSREETAELLRAAKRVYSYDAHTAVIREALLCGAEVYTPKGGVWEHCAPIDAGTSWNDLTETRRLVALAEERFA
jgi:hypothetical protein